MPLHTNLYRFVAALQVSVCAPCSRIRNRFLSLSLLSLIPTLARAEVMDKEFSFLVVLGWSIVGTLAAFAAARFRPWLLAAVLPVVAAFFALHLAEFLDPFVGPAMFREASLLYVALSWGSPAAITVAVAFGSLLRFRHAKTDA